jgi:hypothetical protein
MSLDSTTVSSEFLVCLCVCVCVGVCARLKK